MSSSSDSARSRYQIEGLKYDGVKSVEMIKFEMITTGDKLTKKHLREFKERLKESVQPVGILIMTYRIQVV